MAATVTDANVVLGALDASAFMAGPVRSDRAAAEAAPSTSVAAFRWALRGWEAAAGI